MAAPKGNQFWKQRTKHGRDKLFSTPEILMEACNEYFQWCEDNPLLEEKVFHAAGEITRTTVAKLRALTITGLCLYLRISHETWREYSRRKDFSEVIREADNIIYSQKFNGAAADMLNANIIARDLGLADEKELTGKDGKDLIGATDEELDNRIKGLINASVSTDSDT